MPKQPKVNDDPILALCADLDAALDEERGFQPLWSMREQAVLHAGPDTIEQAERDYRAVNRDMTRIWTKIEACADALSVVRARSLEGVVAKLRATLRHGSSKDTPGEHSWPQHESILRDLEQLAANDNACLSTLRKPTSVEVRDEEELPEREGL